jgi:LuxR family maltose regulon positive regulatory protein
MRLHLVTGMLEAGRGRHQEALGEFRAAGRLQPRLVSSLALASQVTGWTLATQARAGMPAQARAALTALDDENARPGEIRNARAAICLAEGDPAAALAAVQDVLDGTAPVTGHLTVVEAQLLAGLAHQALGDQHAASQATERALALAEPDRLILPFAVTGSQNLLQTLPRHHTAHATLLIDILDILDIVSGSPVTPRQHPAPLTEELSPGELRVLRYLPTNLSRPEIAFELFVSPNTVGTHMRSIYAKLGVRDRRSAVLRARALRLLGPGRTSSS